VDASPPRGAGRDIAGAAAAANGSADDGRSTDDRTRSIQCRPPAPCRDDLYDPVGARQRPGRRAVTRHNPANRSDSARDA